MKFNSYEEYVEATKAHYGNKDIKVPVSFMILSEEMYNLFNGQIDFGTSKTSKCDGNCNCNCKKENQL